MAKKYKKLVRDNIPDIIKSRGEFPKTRILDDGEYLEELIAKLHEEIAEFAKDQNIEEMADIMEVILALQEVLGISQTDLEKTRLAKASKNGRFEHKIYLENVE